MSRDELYASLLLIWSRSIDKHGMKFEEWIKKMPKADPLEVVNAA